jgi:hypothetical protein
LEWLHPSSFGIGYGNCTWGSVANPRAQRDAGRFRQSQGGQICSVAQQGKTRSKLHNNEKHFMNRSAITIKWSRYNTIINGLVCSSLV